MEVIGVLGSIGAGKGTVSDMIVEKHNFTKDSFAGTLKDVCASMFNWPRELLEGDTTESREWREQVDPFWAQKLQLPEFTPRFALQHIGTDVIRKNFCDDMWMFTLENRLLKSGKDVVIADVRFPNEIELVKSLGGRLVEVHRNNKPIWYNIAAKANNGDKQSKIIMEQTFTEVHKSEWAWIGLYDYESIDNNGTLHDLESNVEKFLK